MVTKKKAPEVSITLTESEMCRHYRLKKVNTARWIGTKGNRKIVIYGVPA